MTDLILFPEDLVRIERAIGSTQLGSREAAEVIEAAGCIVDMGKSPIITLRKYWVDRSVTECPGHSLDNDVSRFSDEWDAAQRKVNINSPFKCAAPDDYWLFVKKSDYTKICDIVGSLPSSGLTAQRRIHILKILTNFFYKHNTTQKEQRIREHTTRQKYEYMFMSIFLSMCKLNEYGKDGWELCGVTSDLFYFKRPL